MTSTRPTTPLQLLKQVALERARERAEPLSSAHWLWAVADQLTKVGELLNARGLGTDAISKLEVTKGAEPAELVAQLPQQARELAKRCGAAEADAAHLLVALLSERLLLSHRIAEGVVHDVGRLRGAVMSLALQGKSSAPARPPREAPPRSAAAARPPSERGVSGRAQPPRSRDPRPGQGVTIPTYPPPGKSLMVPRPNVPPVVLTRSSPSPELAPAPARPAALPALVAASPSPPTHDQERAARFVLDPELYPTLAGLGRNLTLAAARGELDPVVGREQELEQVLDVLAKRHGNSAVLVGAPGVGKTSVVRGLAHLAARSEGATSSLDERVIVELPVAELLAGTGLRGALASKVGALKSEVAAGQGKVVLFFDELHLLFTSDGADELVAELRLGLSRGELVCLGTATPEEWRRLTDAEPALARRFSMVEIDEPSREEAFLVLSDAARRFEQHHRVRYSEEALALSIGWSVRYLPGRALPDKALGVLDLAGARAHRRGQRTVEPRGVAEVMAELCEMPVERLLETDAERLLRLEQLLAERVVGHEQGVARIARILRRSAAGLGARRPIGTFLLLGPTGVGKTETAKAIAEVLFHDERAMTRVDLSEYGEAHSVARLIGAPPGYVGHEAGGQLTEAVRKRSYQVVLLDEIEKAHPDVLLAFLGLFDEGRLTDGRGRLVDFTNTVIVMTSNLGADAAGSSARRRVGFGAESAPEHAEVERGVVAAARASLPPELYNRIDEVIVFSPLTRAQVREVAQRALEQLAQRLAATRGLRFEFSEAAIEALLDQGGYEPSLGVRPLKRALARLVEAPLAEQVLAGALGAGSEVQLGVVDGELRVLALRSAGAAE